MVRGALRPGYGYDELVTGITVVVPLMVAAGAAWTVRVSAGEPAPGPMSPV